MLKRLFFLVLLSGAPLLAKAQLLSGDLLDSGRKMTKSSNFEIKGNYQGFLLFELAVNPDGVVTGVKHVPEKGSLVSTPARIEASNLCSSLTFEKGTHYPKIHHVKVRVNFIKNTAATQ